MKVAAYIFFMVILNTSLLAQAPSTQWNKKIGGNESDWGTSVQQTSDDGFIITGASRSFGADFQDVLLLKTDADGDTLWMKLFGGSGREEGLSVQQTSDSGYVIFANTPSYGAGSWDAWLIRTDVNGDTLWTRTFGDSAIDLLYDGKHTTDGGFVITGYTESFGARSIDAWLIKTDANGDTLWTKTFGGSKTEKGYSVQQTSDGGYIVAGYTSSYGAGSPDFWLVKTDASGDTLWTKTYGGNDWDICYSVQQTSDGGYIATGSTESFGADNFNVWLVKTDANGDTLWTSIIGGSGEDQGRSVQQTPDDGYIIAGFTESFGNGSREGWLIRTDANGDSLWTIVFGEENWDQFLSVIQTVEGNYIVTGAFESVIDPGQTDLWLIRTAPDITAVYENQQSAINDFQLRQNYPNPFNPSTRIRYELAGDSHVELTVHNILGQRIRTLVSARQFRGLHEVVWDGCDEIGVRAASGIYLYKLQAGTSMLVQKMLMLK